MNILTRILRPSRLAYAHCDGPCGVYDPASARIAAEAVLSMEKKLAALPNDNSLATENTKSRYIGIKEEQAEIVKRELDILWHDYFKPEHLEKYPNLHDVFWKATKLASKNKVESDPANGEALMSSIEEIHNMFWATKNRTDVPFYRAG
ncbi:MAG TPA: superoxide dismutase, Ni [Tepidiformaceae bacterium]|nr:superoxide dismutase, Ni [Tepidiformaceae bacterium]